MSLPYGSAPYGVLDLADGTFSGTITASLSVTSTFELLEKYFSGTSTCALTIVDPVHLYPTDQTVRTTDYDIVGPITNGGTSGIWIDDDTVTVTDGTIVSDGDLNSYSYFNNTATSQSVQFATTGITPLMDDNTFMMKVMVKAQAPAGMEWSIIISSTGYYWSAKVTGTGAPQTETFWISLGSLPSDPGVVAAVVCSAPLIVNFETGTGTRRIYEIEVTGYSFGDYLYTLLASPAFDVFASLDVYARLNTIYAILGIFNATTDMSLDLFRELFFTADVTAAATASITLDVILGEWLVDALDLSDSIESRGEFTNSLTELAKISDNTLVQAFVSLIEGISISTLAEVLRRTQSRLTEALRASESTSSVGVLNSTLDSRIAILAVLEELSTVLLSDSIETNETLQGLIEFFTSISSNISINDPIESYISIYNILGDGIEIDNQVSTSGVLHSLVSDGMHFLEFTIDGENYEAYVLNPEGSAVSQYTNYGFNGVAKLGTFYTFSSPSGLYVMNGTDDDGESIVPSIVTAAMDFGTDKLKQVPLVYMGISNEKTVLRVSVDGQATAYYELNDTVSGLRTKKVKIGKGLVGRYWQFELTAIDGGSLELDNFEFLPVFFRRKT